MNKRLATLSEVIQQEHEMVSLFLFHANIFLKFILFNNFKSTFHLNPYQKSTKNQQKIKSKKKVTLKFNCPSRGLIGFRSQMTTLTRGTAILSNLYSQHVPYLGFSFFPSLSLTSFSPSLPFSLLFLTLFFSLSPSLPFLSLPPFSSPPLPLLSLSSLSPPLSSPSQKNKKQKLKKQFNISGAMSGVEHGSLISMYDGKATAYALAGLESRGALFIKPQVICFCFLGERERGREER